MNTFLEFLGDALPTSGTRLSVLSFELPRAITPEVAGLTVGAFVGVVGFIAVLLLVGRGSRRGAERRAQPQLQPHHPHQERSAAQVVIAPHGTMQRDTPLPPAAFQVSSVHGSSMLLPFRPSTELSARVFAKMGYGVDADDAAMTGPVPALKSGPHPLGIIPTGSSAMQAARPASFADLDLDDGATEIGEPYFDEPPQPHRRTDPPRIRPVAPSGPRFPAATQARTSFRRHHP